MGISDGEYTEVQKCGFGARNRMLGDGVQVGYHGKYASSSCDMGDLWLYCHKRSSLRRRVICEIAKAEAQGCSVWCVSSASAVWAFSRSQVNTCVGVLIRREDRIKDLLDMPITRDQSQSFVQLHASDGERRKSQRVLELQATIAQKFERQM